MLVAELLIFQLSGSFKFFFAPLAPSPLLSPLPPNSLASWKRHKHTVDHSASATYPGFATASSSSQLRMVFRLRFSMAPPWRTSDFKRYTALPNATAVTTKFVQTMRKKEFKAPNSTAVANKNSIQSVRVDAVAPRQGHAEVCLEPQAFKQS